MSNPSVYQVSRIIDLEAADLLVGGLHMAVTAELVEMRRQQKRAGGSGGVLILRLEWQGSQSEEAVSESP
jgi:hypothetical protein